MKMSDYTSKTYDGFEIRFYELENNETCGRLFKDNKPIGIKNKRDVEVIHMEYGNKTSILKKLRGAISNYNSGKADIVEVDKLEANKFVYGDIIIENDTNIVELSDVRYVFNAGNPYDKEYTLLLFDDYKDNQSDPVIDELVGELLIQEFNTNKKEIDERYTCIGNDPNIAIAYRSIQDLRKNVIEQQHKITDMLDVRLNMLNKSNMDFYNDLLAQIHKSNVSEYEKKKYIEFVEAAYKNREEI